MIFIFSYVALISRSTHQSKNIFSFLPLPILGFTYFSKIEKSTVLARTVTLSPVLEPRRGRRVEDLFLFRRLLTYCNLFYIKQRPPA